VKWFRKWRINRIKERIAALQDMIPLYQTLAKQCSTCYYDEKAINATGEVAALRVRLVRLEGE
jgi:hypothetical protein